MTPFVILFESTLYTVKLVRKIDAYVRQVAFVRKAIYSGLP